MRDPNRIKPMLEYIAEKWEAECPDWRFGQLISNFWSWYANDIFFLEDDEFKKLVDKFFADCFGSEEPTGNDT